MQGRRVEELAAGAGAGLFATAVLHPLDLIKTRMQVQDARSQGRRLPMYRGLFHGVRSIVSLEGWAGLFQGLGPNLIGSTTSWGLYMYLYALCKDGMAPCAPQRLSPRDWAGFAREPSPHATALPKGTHAGLRLTRLRLASDRRRRLRAVPRRGDRGGHGGHPRRAPDLLGQDPAAAAAP